MKNTDTFHYPPELFDLLVQTLPILSKSKESVLLFFRGAGVPEDLYKDISTKVNTNRDSINKYEICRTILSRINEDNDNYIRQRRELLKRVVEFDSFTNCWETDQYKAKGLVSEIRNIVNVKDSFTRMKQEKEKEQSKHSEEYNRKIKEVQDRKKRIDNIKQDLYALFGIKNPQERGKKLEHILNALFSVDGMLVKEAFSRIGNKGDGIIEQIDGVVEIDNKIYFVEMKWKKDKIGADDIFSHLGRINHRAQAQGIFISESGFTPSGITASKEALIKNTTLILADLQEFVYILENDKDLRQYFKSKINNAIINKDPYTKP